MLVEGRQAGVLMVAAPDVLSREVGGEAVLLDLTTGRYFGLNSTGARIWSLLQRPIHLEELVRALAVELEAPESQLRADVSDLMSHLLERGLVKEHGR